MAITTSGMVNEQKDSAPNGIETSDIEESLTEEIGKENILSDKISIGANKQSLMKDNKVIIK